MISQLPLCYPERNVVLAPILPDRIRRRRRRRRRRGMMAVVNGTDWSSMRRYTLEWGG
jgi:hypothetical protein